MSTADPSLTTAISPAADRALHRDFMKTRFGDLLPLADFVVVLASGFFSLSAYTRYFAGSLSPAISSDLQRLVGLAAISAAFILYEQGFAPLVLARNHAAVRNGFIARWLLLMLVFVVMAFAAGWLQPAPRGWLYAWLACAVLISAGSRVLFASHLRRSVAGQTADSGGSTAAASPPPGRIARIGESLPVRLLADRPIKCWNAVLKNAKDRVLGVLILLLLAPVLATIAVAIRLDSRGPVLFKQRRHGINNREFSIYKFRSMHCAPMASNDTLQQTVRGDPRVTRVGAFLRKWSLDELPQIFNVLEGSMSLVGPRPHAVNMRTEQRLGHEIIDSYCHRHRVKPGITGWSQINGSRGATDTVDQLRRRVELDLHYVDNWSLLFDLKILSLTFKEVLRATNAY